MAKLVIERTKAFRDVARAYKIRFDGREVGKIGSGERKTFEVPAGVVAVQMGIDWCGSPILDVEVNEDSPKVLTCRPNVNPFLALLYITIWRNQYIALEEEI
ncbi:MAG: hypothetical protein IPK50_06515 [Fibrobacterota bacterium]|nr:MAG: hypothetical protein IPK50_06515 [Fibrobacterota bacterium]